MRIIKDTLEICTNTEAEAKQCLEKYRSEAAEKGYLIKSAGYTYKTKKSKGEIVGEAWICKVVLQLGEVWD